MTSAGLPGRPATVVQVGDIAGVATQLTAALEAHTDWRSVPVGVAELRRHGRVARMLDWPARALSTRRAVREATARVRPDVVHLHWARYAPFLDLGGVPLVVHVHGSDVRGQRATLAGRLVDRALRRAAAVVVSTPDLLSETPPGAMWLPNPVDVERFAITNPPVPRQLRESDASDRPVVLMFARLVDVKGADRLLAAAEEIRRRRPDIRAVGFAGGPYETQARAAGLELVAAVDRDDVPGLLRSVDVVIGQQRLGALGLSELEAMAAGRPVIVSLRRDLYPEAVPVENPVEPVDIAAAAIALIDDPQRRAALGAQGRDWVVAHHAPAAVAGALAEVYEGVR